MGARILVVDDNATNLDLMVYLLRAFGHAPTGVKDGAAALEKAAAMQPDLVLCDILMPNMDGFEFARRFKTIPQMANVPLVGVTALAMVGDRDRILEAGFDGYLAKPIDPETFVTQVEAFLRVDLHAGTAKAERPDGADAAHQANGSHTVLVVDDVQVNLDVIAGTLRPFGYRIIEAHNVEAALRKMQEVTPELILCDVHMPGGDGFGLIERAKSDPRFADVPFLFMSSTAWQTSDKTRGMELGAKGFILRPIDPTALLAAIEAALVK